MGFLLGLHFGSYSYRNKHNDIVFYVPKSKGGLCEKVREICYNKLLKSPSAEETDDGYIFSIECKKVSELFQLNGFIKNYYHSLSIPSKILESRTSVLCSFIRGAFISRGKVSEEGLAEITNLSASEASQFTVCLESLGILCKSSLFRRYKESSIYRLSTLNDFSNSIFRYKIAIGNTDKEKALKTISLDDLDSSQRNFFSDSISIASEIYSNLDEETKKKLMGILKSALSKAFVFLKNLLKFDKKNSIDIKYLNNSYIYDEDEVVSIEDEICDTFDFEVPKSHMYISSSFISHNSISYQMGCAQSIEPDMKVLFVYENKSGNYYLLNKNFVDDMKKEGIWNEEFAEKIREFDGYISELDIPEKYKSKYKNAFDRDQFKLIEANAERQKWIDMGISFNSWNNKTSLKFLNDIYTYSNELGLKSNYYLRGVAASKVSQTKNKIERNETPQETDSNQDDAAKMCSLEAMVNGGTCEMCEG